MGTIRTLGKKTLSIAFLTTFLLLLPALGSACTIPTDDMQINNDTILCGGPGTEYFLDDVNDDGVINFTANYVKLDCNGTTIYGNDSQTNAGWGIYAKGSLGINVTNCIVRNYSKCVYFYDVTNSLVSDSTFTTNSSGDLPVHLVGSTSSTTLTNLSISATNSYGIFVDGNSNSNTISFSSITTSGAATAVYVGSGTEGNIIENSLLNATAHPDVTLVAVGGKEDPPLTNLYLINVTMNEPATNISLSVDGDGSKGYVVRQWHLDVHVNYTTGLDAASADVNITQADGTLVYSAQTDSSGYVYGVNLTEFWANGTGFYYSDYNNYTVNASKGRFPKQTMSVNMTQDSVATLTFHVVPPAYSDVLNVTPATFNTSAQLNFSINWSVNWTETSLTSVWIEVNRSGTLTLYQASNISDATLWNLSLSDFPAGTHHWRSNATDDVGNVNTTDWYAFTIDKIAPTRYSQVSWVKLNSESVC